MSDDAPDRKIDREATTAAPCILIAGRCQAFRDERGRRVPLRMLGTGDVFGENARIATEIVSFIGRTGTWERPGVLGTSWSRLWLTLADECRLTEDHALSIVARTKDLDYDAVTDEITLALLSMA